MTPEQQFILALVGLIIAGIPAIIAAWKGVQNGAQLATMQEKVDAIHTNTKGRS